MRETDPLLRPNHHPTPDISTERDFQRKLRIRASNANLCQLCMDLAFLVIAVGYYLAIIASLSCEKYSEVCMRVEGDSILDSGMLNMMLEDSWIMDLNITTQIPSPTPAHRNVTHLYMASGLSMLYKSFFCLVNVFVTIFIAEESNKSSQRARFLTKFLTIGRVATAFVDTLALICGYLLFEAHDSVAVGIFGIMIYPMVQLFYVLGTLYAHIEITICLKEAEEVQELLNDAREVEEFEMSDFETEVADTEEVVMVASVV